MNSHEILMQVRHDLVERFHERNAGRLIRSNDSLQRAYDESLDLILTLKQSLLEREP